MAPALILLHQLFYTVWNYNLELLSTLGFMCVDMSFSSKCHDMSICVVIKQM